VNGAAAPVAGDTGLREAVAQARRWYWQRISAMVLALCVVIHLAGMVWAVRGGLSAAEILSRTQGNALFAAFYAVFVLACAVHVPLGLVNDRARVVALVAHGAAAWFARASPPHSCCWACVRCGASYAPGA
jgi:fumarate reductase subunit C